MLLSPDFFNSLNENFIQTDDCWAWSTEDVYSIGYKELLVQPINLNTVSLDYFRLRAPTTEITIRYGTTSASPFIFQGYSYNIDEFEVVDHNSLNGLQGGSTTTERYHLSASTYGYLQTVSANVQDQINLKANQSSLSAYTLTTITSGISANFNSKINSISANYTSRTEVSGVSANLQNQINTTNFNLQTSSTSLQIQIDTLSQQSISGMGAGTINRVGKFVTSGSLGNSSINDDGSLVKIHNSLSASGNISANSFVKSGGTSAQFLKANGSVDSNVYITSSSLTPYTLTTTTSAISANLQNQINLKANQSSLSAYTLTTTTSAISANLQNQINNNNNKLSAYLPVSGGNVYGRLYLGNSSNNGYLDLRTNGTSAGQTDINYRGGTSANRRMTIRYDEIKDAIEIFSSNDDGSARTNIQRMYRDQNTPSRYYTGLDVFSGNLSVQNLSASKLVATDASKNLISYNLTSADIANHAQKHYYDGPDPINGQALSGLLNTSSPTFSTLKLVKALGTTISAATRIELLNNDSTYGQSFWSDSGSNLRLAFLHGDSTWTDKFKFLNTGALSAVGNITAPQFNGNLNGYKNVDNGNECTISNGFASNQSLFINYRGATSSINEYVFWNGRSGSGDYSRILASAFKMNGGTSTQFLKADGSVDTNVYTTTATTSSVSATLQSQITNNNNKLSAYLSLSGGTLTGQLLVKSNVSASGDIIGSRHIIPGGLASQFLKADGSVDSNSYALDTLGDYYLALSGGTLGGDVVSKNFRPTAPFFNDLGTVFFPYLSLYVSAINANKINMEGSIIPINSILYDLGSNSNRWSTIYTRDLKSVAVNTVTDRAVEAVDVKSHILIGFDNQLAPHLNFSTSLGTSANLSGDFYFDGTSLKIRDKNSVLKTLSYTSDLSAYTPTSGSITITSAYLPLSGGTLAGNLSATQTISITKGLGTTISAATRLELMNNNFTWGAAPWIDSGGNMRIAYLQGDGVWTDRYILNRSGALSAVGNVTAPQFNGNLNGYKNVDNGNECTISNGFAYPGNLYINYRGAVSAISAYHFWNGFAGSGGYSSIVANSFIKNGGTSSQFLKADGSSDSNVYTTTATTSSISATLQNQITNNNNKLSAYLPISGGTLTGDVQTGNLIRNDFGLWDIGTSVKRYNTIYGTNGDYYWLSASYLNVESSFLPYNSFTVDLGSSSKRFKDLYIKNTYSNAFETTDTSFTSRYTHKFGDNTTSAATHAQVHFQARPLVINSTSGDMYWSGSRFVVMDNTGNNRQLAYTTDLAYYTPTSGFNQTISTYLPLSGGTLTRNLKISAYSEGWSEGLRIMAPSNNWGGVRLSRNNSINDTEDNWAIGYANNSTGNLEFDVYTGGSQLKHTIFYKNGSIYHLGNVSANNFVTNSSIIVQNPSRTNDSIKFYDNQILMRNATSQPYIGVSGSFVSSAGCIFNVFSDNSSYKANIKTDRLSLTQGFGANGSTKYLDGTKPTVNSADTVTNQLIAIRTILSDLGLINVI